MLNLHRKVLCLDWDKRSLRIVVARVGKGRAVLEDAHSHWLPSEVDADDPEALGDFIRSMLKRHRLSQRSVVVDVPRERAVMNRLTLPPTPAAEVAAAVRFQALKELPFPLDSAAMDYIVTRRDERGLVVEVLLAAITLETLARVQQTCTAAGLAPARIGLRPYANLLSVQQMRTAPAGALVLFVDIGPGATEIDIFSGDTLAFARSANVNVPLPAGDVSDSRILSPADLGPLGGGDAIESAVGELMVETMRTLQAFRATAPEATIDEVIVAGGTGIEGQLAERLGQKLATPVALYDPTGPLGIQGSEAPKLRSFSAALGLAWGLAREGALALDFLNPKRPVSSREVLQRRARTIALGSVMMLVLVVGLIGRQYASRLRVRDQLRSANDTLYEQAREKQTLQNRIEEANDWATEAVWADELLNITNLAQIEDAQPGEKLIVQEVSMDTVSRTPGIVLRNLHATDWEVPTEFVKRLNSERASESGRLYEASQMSWSQLTDGQKFKGKTDVRVQLRKLLEFKERGKKRAEERKQKLKELAR